MVSSYEYIENKLDNDTMIFIMNNNYKEEIIKMTNNKYNYITL